MFYLFSQQAANISALEIFSLFFIYILNSIAILFLLLLPAILWYLAFKGKELRINKKRLSLILTSLIIFFIAPVFRIERLMEENVLGVDIKTFESQNILFSNFFQVLFFALILFFMMYFFMKHYKKYFLGLGIFTGLIFFTYYIYLFFTSQFSYYIEVIIAIFTSSGIGLCKALIDSSGIFYCSELFKDFGMLKVLFNAASYILSVHFLIFFSITILFYITGFIMFIDELIKEKVYKKLS